MRKTAAALITIVILAAFIITACLPAGLDSGKKLTVAVDATYPPFEYVNEKTGQLEGFGIELMKAVAEKAGLDIDFVNVEFEKLLTGVASCQYDMACSSISITEERKKSMLFSDPVNSGGQVVIVRIDNTDIKSKDDLGGRVVAAQAGTTAAMAAEQIDGVKLKTSTAIDLVFGDLLEGGVDAVVADNQVSAYYIEKNPGKLKQAGDIFTDEQDGIAVCKKNEYLVAKINAALKALKDDGTLDKLKAKWITGK
ncbi:MAG: basic amino acid ABC transporter substrate-binding protein [Dehalococcoidia bacterium]|nr:basic amino acid ABC transporter substrate-binding protein [Dehalococcoidia bacterium]